MFSARPDAPIPGAFDVSDATVTAQPDLYFDGIADELAPAAAEQLAARVEDWGVGPYEYCGARGVHADLRLTIAAAGLSVDVTGAETIPVTARGLIERDEAEAEFVLRLDGVRWVGRRLVADYIVEQE